MSKARRIPDAERTATMLDLLRRSYEGEHNEQRLRAYVVIEECAPSTGFAHRWADVVALSVWPSNGLTLDGYEIKASRADLKRELSDLSKHRAVARYCDTWTLLAWDESVLTEDVPADWGIDLTKDGDHGRQLVTHRKALNRVAEPWPRAFVCSLIRNAHEQSPGAAYLARAVLAAHARAESDYRYALERAVSAAVEPLARALYGKDRWRSSSEPEEIVKAAVERLTQPLLAVENTR